MNLFVDYLWLKYRVVYKIINSLLVINFMIIKLVVISNIVILIEFLFFLIE